MARKTWVISDRDDGVYLDALDVGPRDCGLSDDDCAGITKRTLRGGLSDGVDAIDVDNGAVRFRVLPTRGMGLGGLWLADGRSVAWRSPIRGPVHPKFVNLADPSGLGWLDGFDEFLCRCGLESNGAPEFDAAGKLVYPLHGKIANRPAHRVAAAFDDATREIAIVGEVDESRFLFSKLRLTTTIRTRLGESGLRIRDEVTNLSAAPAKMQLLYHINFGGPLLGEGARLVAPIEQLAPRNAHAAADLDRWDTYAAPRAGFVEQVYFMTLAADDRGQSQVLLRSGDGSLGASVRCDVRALPCFTLWKNTAAEQDGHVTGLEPGTNFPNPRSFEQRHERTVRIEPGQTRGFDIAVELHASADAVRDAEANIARLQGSTAPTIHRTGPADWCAS
ncbi:MAG: aldose 1-epimerase family protein [Pirellulales bacterium]